MSSKDKKDPYFKPYELNLTPFVQQHQFEYPLQGKDKDPPTENERDILM